MAVNRIIYVSRNGQSNHVKLRDEKNNPGNNKLTTEVEPSDTVTWRLEKKSDLTEIIGIRESDSSKPEYRGSQNLFASPPRREKDGSWTATMTTDNSNRPKFQNYMVGFKIPGSNEEFWDDPKLLMN